MNICGLQENGIDDLICKAEIKTQMRTNMNAGGVGKMNWEVGTDTYIHY